MIKVNINNRLEKLLTQLEMRHHKIKALKKAKAQLFLEADEQTKDVLLKYEELESIERTIITRFIYKQAITDTLKKRIHY